MTFNFGINNQNSENSLTLGYSNLKYTQRLLKLLNIEEFNHPLRIDLVFSRSSYFSKYTLDIKNPIFFKVFNEVWTTNLEINSKNKKIKYINYEILPAFKLSLKSASKPISIYLKHANYRASGEQEFGGYDYSQLLKSLLPYDRTSIGVKYEDVYDFKSKKDSITLLKDLEENLKENKPQINSNNERDLIEKKHKYKEESFLDKMLVYKLKLSYNKIKGYEDSVKFRATTKYFRDLDLNSKFRLGVTNETSLKNSFIFNTKGTGRNVDYSSNNPNISSFGVSSEEGTIVSPHHILSTSEAYSRILDLNINNVYREFNVGNKFCLTNHMQVKLKPISKLSKDKLLSHLHPFVGFEVIFIPVFDKSFYNYNSNSAASRGKSIPFYKLLDYEESFKFVANAGISLEINENISIDFTLKTYAKGFNSLDASVLDRFRMNMNLSMNI